MDWLANQIKQLQRNLDRKVESLNCGGCIYFAYYFSEKLKELHIEHKFFIVHYQPIDIRKGKSDGFIHVMIYIPEIGYIDGESIYSSLKEYMPYRKYYRHIKLSKSKVETLIHERSWNPSYNINQNAVILSNINKYIYLPSGRL